MNELEKKFVYRLVKVTYIFALLVGVLIVGVIGWTSKPETYIDSDKSSLSCNNGKGYTLDSVGIYLIADEAQLDTYDDRKAKIACAYGAKDDYITRYDLPSTPNYQVNYVNSVRGSWQSALLWWVLGFLGVYASLNLLKETLLYVFLGKKFSWEWLKRLIALFSDNKK